MAELATDRVTGTTEGGLDLRSLIRPVRRHSVLAMPGYHVWCGSMTRTEDGRCHLYFSRWPEENFTDWVIKSEIGHAVADHPLGPYVFQDVALGRLDHDAWDRDNLHNPAVKQFGDAFYLYYNGNYGNGEYWDHRNHQRVGVAVADRPEGPWRRFDRPLLDVNPKGWDKLITTNPTVAELPDGRFMMIYKASDKRAPAPMYGPVLHGVAFADSPLGPFRRHPEPIFAAGGVNFPGEDPFLFVHHGRIHCLLKDMGTSYSPIERALILFESADGITWQPGANRIACTRSLTWEDGTTQEFCRLERPHLHLENGEPAALFVAAMPKEDCGNAYNLHIPLADNIC